MWTKTLTSLGLALDTLKIKSWRDSANYLESIGRQRIAEVIRDAEIAESTAMAEARQEEAIANIKEQMWLPRRPKEKIISMENKLRELKADLDAKFNPRKPRHWPLHNRPEPVPKLSSKKSEEM